MRIAALAAAVSILAAGVVAAPSAPASAATAARGPARVAIVMPLSLHIDSGAFVPAEDLETATGPTGSLTLDLDAVLDTEVTLAIDPMLIASIRVLGSAAPQSARDWLSRLAAASNPSFALAYADADLTAPLQAGETRPLELGNLAFGIDPSHFSGAVPTASPTPTSTPDPNAAPPLPDAGSLTEWTYSQDAIAWPRADTVTTADLASLSKSDFDAVLLSSKNVSRDDRTRAAVRVPGQRVVVTDETVSELADRALNSFGDDEWADASSALRAAVTAYRDGSTSVITLDRMEALEPTRIAQVLEVVDGAARTTVTSLDSITGSRSTTGRVLDRPQSGARVDLVRQMLAAEKRVVRFSSVATDPSLITGERRARLLVSLSPGADAAAEGFSSVVQSYLDESTKTLDSVHVEQGSAITLLADRASIFVSVTNDLDQPATVLVTVRPLAPLIAVSQQNVVVEVKAHSQRKASIPVKSLSNGTVILVVSLSSPTGVRIGAPTSVSTSVRAGWEGPVTFGLAGAIAIVFAFGLWRALVRRRRNRDSATDDEDLE
jgi:hypothetical protein